MRILILKTSSLGDIIHTLPALTDVQRAIPEVQFDWVVEPAFQEIPQWHNAVRSVILAPLRRWRKHWRAALSSGELQRFLGQLRANQYDFVVDAQGLLKSAVLAFLARGRRIGFDFGSAREKWAACLYQKRVSGAKTEHAIERIRTLFSSGLGYLRADTAPSYGINFEKLLTSAQLVEMLRQSVVSEKTTAMVGREKMDWSWIDKFEERPYYLFLHGTTWPTKHWPEAYWVQLAQYASQQGKQIYLLWGNEIEAARAKRIVEKVSGAHIVPSLSLNAIARLLAGADGVVTPDTGLGHLAAALGTPTVGLYGPNFPERSGMVGSRVLNLSVQYPCAPCLRRTCVYAKNREDLDPPPCFSTLSADKVWANFFQLLNRQ